MTARALPIVNAIGCLALAGLVVAQWRKESVIDKALAARSAELAVTNDRAAEERKRCTSLERDVAVLKEAIESTQQAAESAAHSLAEKDQTVVQLQTDLAAAGEQVAAWQSALKERDERISKLNADLAATRKRLDEAIARIKVAGSAP
jgi:chromosome segregation ATPase